MSRQENIPMEALDELGSLGQLLSSINRYGDMLTAVKESSCLEADYTTELLASAFKSTAVGTLAEAVLSEAYYRHQAKQRPADTSLAHRVGSWTVIHAQRVGCSSLDLSALGRTPPKEFTPLQKMHYLHGAFNATEQNSSARARLGIALYEQILALSPQDLEASRHLSLWRAKLAERAQMNPLDEPVEHNISRFFGQLGRPEAFSDFREQLNSFIGRYCPRFSAQAACLPTPQDSPPTLSP